MLTENPWLDFAALNALYRAYGRALQELREHPEGTSWEGTDDDMIVLATSMTAAVSSFFIDFLPVIFNSASTSAPYPENDDSVVS